MARSSIRSIIPLKSPSKPMGICTNAALWLNLDLKNKNTHVYLFPPRPPPPCPKTLWNDKTKSMADVVELGGKMLVGRAPHRKPKPQLGNKRTLNSVFSNQIPRIVWIKNRKGKNKSLVIGQKMKAEWEVGSPCPPLKPAAFSKAEDSWLKRTFLQETSECVC